MGFFMQYREFSKALNILIFLIGFILIVKNKNKNGEAVLWAAYIVGSEVLFRMTKGLIFYELSKYMVFVFLITGMLVEKKKHEISPVYIIYILLLLVGIAFSEIPFPQSIRTNVIFNLSGPILLGVSGLYFFKRKIYVNNLLNILFWMALPIITMVSYLYFKTPDIKDIIFGGNASLSASGGYGPNQVSTILGVGSFVFIAHILLKKKFSTIFLIDILLLFYIIYRNLLTFSRGGFVTSIIAILFFGFFIIYSRKDRFLSFFKYVGIGLLFAISIGLYTSNITGGMLENRYTNKNARGEVKEDITTGRLLILNTELEAFYENPIFGMGVGSGKFRRVDSLGLKVASHNEISRLLGEHGLLGVVILILLLLIPIVNAWKQPPYAKAFLGAFYIFWFLTINHSAMRIALPSFIYGLSLISIELKKEKTLKK